jgi:hypothetical protein
MLNVLSFDGHEAAAVATCGEAGVDRGSKCASAPTLLVAGPAAYRTCNTNFICDSKPNGLRAISSIANKP